MPTTAGTQNDAGDLLNSLLELCHDVRAGHEAALNVVKRETALALVHRGLAMLANHIERLRDPALRLSQNVSDSTDPRSLLERAKVRLAGLMGEAAAVSSLQSSVDDLVAAYARGENASQMPEPGRFLCKQLHQEAVAFVGEMRGEVEDKMKHSDNKASDHDEVTRGRAMPRVDAAASRLDNSTDY